MLEAMSTGDGSLCTLHARSAPHAIDRIVTLCLSAGVVDDRGVRLPAARRRGRPRRAHRRCSTSRPRRRQAPVRLDGPRDRRARRGGPARDDDGVRPGPDGRAVPAHRPACLDDLVRAGFDPALLDHRGGTWGEPLSSGVPGEHRPRRGSRWVRGRRLGPGRGRARADERSGTCSPDSGEHALARPRPAGHAGAGLWPSPRVSSCGRSPGGRWRGPSRSLPWSASRSCCRRRRRRRAIDRVEAIEEWTRRLADVVATGTGLEQAITVTARTSPPELEREVAALVARLAARWSTEDALRSFADDLDDAAGDLVVAALVLAARRRGPGPGQRARCRGRVGGRGRRRAPADRGRAREAADHRKAVTLITLGVVAVGLLNGAYLEPYGTRRPGRARGDRRRLRRLPVCGCAPDLPAPEPRFLAGSRRRESAREVTRA